MFASRAVVGQPLIWTVTSWKGDDEELTFEVSAHKY